MTRSRAYYRSIPTAAVEMAAPQPAGGVAHGTVLAPERAREEQMARGKILVVDDSPVDRVVMSEPLRQHGYTVVTAADSNEALAQLEREQPDLLLLDVIMPGVNGFQLCRTLRRDPRYARLPIVLVTSKNQPADRHWGLKQGASDYLAKPFTADQLLATVRRLV
ncbi:MAG TPA: response regulator [Chloroflexota bacterium]|jgi:twitching motility two-component system response regulator PilH|nr:response regulator [Chloroflexota bacterium]